MDITLEPVRRLLLLPLAALAVGFLIILHMPVGSGWRAAAVSAWLALQGRELYRFGLNAGRFVRIRMTGDSEWHGGHRDGSFRPLSLRGGYYIGDRYLWLRCATDDGCSLDTLLLRSRLPRATWRRLHVILRLRR